MALDLQAILNEAVSEVLGKEGQSINESVTDVVNEALDNHTVTAIVNQIKKLKKDLEDPNLGDYQREDIQRQIQKLQEQLKGGVSDEAKEGIMDKVTGALHKIGKAVEDHPYAAAATGAIAAGLGALGVRKLIKKPGGFRRK